VKNGKTYEGLERHLTPKSEKLLNKFISRLLKKQKITQRWMLHLKKLRRHCTKVIRPT